MPTRRNTLYRQGDQVQLGDSSTAGGTRASQLHPNSNEKSSKNGRTAWTATRRVLYSRKGTAALWLALAVILASFILIIVKIEVGIDMQDPSATMRLQNEFHDKISKESPSKSLGETPATVEATAETKEKNDRNKSPTGNQKVDKASTMTAKKKKKLNDAGSKNSTEKPLEIDMKIEDPPIFEAPVIHPNIQDFDPTINGVVVTKIHGPNHLRILRQMLCLFTKAYNHRVNHDIIVFTSEAIDQDNITALEQLVHPAKLIVEVDNPGLHKMVEDLSPARKKHLLDRCNVTSTSELSWYTECSEETSYKALKHERIAYCWQAEFRSLWLWTHRLLAPYKYMMWVDADMFCTRTWKQDPFAAMERHDLALLFDHFPAGSSRGYEIPRIIKDVYDRVICNVNLVNGTLVPWEGRCLNRKKNRIYQVHGFFHVSSLDFYRSDNVMKWNRALIGDSKFSRQFDDQIGITIPAAVLAGNRSRDMKSLGIYPRVFHNYVLDGRPPDWRGYFVKWWKRNANTTFPEASGQCVVDISG